MRPLTAVIILSSLLSVACVGPAPVREYNLARTALDAARGAKSPEHAPGYWARAHKSYQEGELFYKERDFAKAKESFLRAKLFAERAENFTVIKIMREGGDL